MDDGTVFQNVLGVFAHYGFRKTSMSELAAAANISRQTLYNRFGTKDAVLEWALEGYAANAGSLAEEQLNATDVPVRQRLLNAFMRWIGDGVSVIHNSPHGAEILDLGMAALKRSDADPHIRFEKSLSQFLLKTGICKTDREADDKTFLLLTAAKGLLLKSNSSEAFGSGMMRIIDSAIVVGD
ncbi:MAG: TetR/AcrR family transcriptional regulator [Alphaproteobacteria bacterium]|nr:TetR/AcrR family transcriptional regulator [Alphaproteobacteria bacterium]